MPKGKLISIRVSEPLLEQISKRCDDAGFTRRGDYIRHCLRREIDNAK